MSRRVRWVLIVVALVVAVSVALNVFLSTGVPKTAASADPFVGTWQSTLTTAPGNGLVISKGLDGYSVVMTDSSRGVMGWRCYRHGDELKGTGREANLDQPDKPFAFVEAFILGPAPGRLTWTETENGLRNPSFILSKVSDSATLPTPWPTTSAPAS